ncbi:MAG: aminopeptidase P family protein [Elusimicrobia bacterium]|nr:aminopeptidase P family protein [Elusimicrobiota bacterium]
MFVFDPKINKDCAAHRKALRKILPDGLTLVSGGVEVARNNDVNYVFRQTSDFLYLAGVPEPNYFLMLDPKGGRDTLFIPRVDAHHRVWLGHVPDVTETRRTYGIGDVRYTDELPAVLKKARSRYRAVYADGGALRRLRPHLKGLKPRPGLLDDALQVLRAVKTQGEIELMRRANDISREGHVAVMKTARPGMREYELQAEFERTCTRLGLRHQGYPPIVAAGKNGAVLHYHHNNQVIKKGDLLLIDAGGECGGYSADITRTFPVGGRFSRRQRDIYAVVLEAQKQCIDRARPGVLSGDLHYHSMRVLADGLKDLGFLKGPTDDLVYGGAVRLFYPHGLTHMLGLDVHDSLGGRKRQVPCPPHIRVRFNARLEAGFAITMEPGVYFNPALFNDSALRKKYRGQIDFKKAESFYDFGGVRIEDDIVVRPSGPPLNLTSVPKEIDDVEAACGY